MRRLLLSVLIVLFGICVSCIPKEEEKPHWLTATSLDVDGDIIRDTNYTFYQGRDPIRFSIPDNKANFYAVWLLMHSGNCILSFDIDSDTSFFYYNENCLPKNHEQSFVNKNFDFYKTKPEVSTSYLRFVPSDAPGIAFSFEFEFTNMINSHTNDTIRSFKGRVDVGECPAPWWPSRYYAFQKDLGPAKFLRYRE